MFNIDLLSKVLMIPAILVAFTFHEYAHAIVSYRLGDDTPRKQGRLSLNPFIHVDPIGFIMILVFGFGWARPVQTNPLVYKNYYKDDLKVSLAGPVANLIVAFAFSIILGFFIKFANSMPFSVDLITIFYKALYYIVYINIMLFFFNLLPVPGMDGFHALRDIFPEKFYKNEEKLYRYQMLILLIILVTPVAGYIIGGPTRLVASFFFKIATIIGA